MSIQDRAREFVLNKAKELEAEAGAIGILRSVEATEASRWLREVATALRTACTPEDGAEVARLREAARDPQ